jgi:hypothetical protein
MIHSFFYTGQTPASVPPKSPEKGMVHGIRPDELVRLTPKLQPYLRRPNPTWPDIVDAHDPAAGRP